MTWATIDRQMMEFGFTPEMVDEMTLAEISVAMIDPDPAKANPPMSPAEMEAYFAWWRSLTPEEQLWAEADL